MAKTEKGHENAVIESLDAKLSRSVGILFKLRHVLPSSTFRYLYFALIRITCFMAY